MRIYEKIADRRSGSISIGEFVSMPAKADKETVLVVQVELVPKFHYELGSFSIGGREYELCRDNFSENRNFVFEKVRNTKN